MFSGGGHFDTPLSWTWCFGRIEECKCIRERQTQNFVITTEVLSPGEYILAVTEGCGSDKYVVNIETGSIIIP